MVRFCAFGPLGSGKTLVLVKEALRYTRKHPKNTVFSNVPLTHEFFPTYKPLTSVRDFFKIKEPCFLLDDEAWTTGDSRTPSAPENKAKGVLLLRSRKQDWTYGYSQQWYTQVDLRIRFITDLWILPQFHVKTGVLQEDIYDLFANFIGSRCYDGRKFFDLYDTHADPSTLDLDELAREFDRKKLR